MEAAFGAGCFWHVQESFDKIKGIKKTIVGYMGGKIKNPNYSQVCTGKTGHAETLYLNYDENKISYNELLKLFWKIHNPTQLGGQGVDYGSQYRSIIFYYNDDQKRKAIKSLKEEQKKYDKKIVTEIVKASVFYKAEEYHQKYYKKNKLKVC